MSAVATPQSQPIADLHARFLSIRPRIQEHARIYFRHVKCRGKREDFIAETIALAWTRFLRLVQRGKDVASFISTSATRCAQAVRNGRRLCGQEKPKDVMSTVCQQRRGFAVESLPASTMRAHEDIYSKVGGQRQMDTYEEIATAESSATWQWASKRSTWPRSTVSHPAVSAN